MPETKPNDDSVRVMVFLDHKLRHRPPAETEFRGMLEKMTEGMSQGMSLKGKYVGWTQDNVQGGAYKRGGFWRTYFVEFENLSDAVRFYNLSNNQANLPIMGAVFLPEDYPIQRRSA